MTQAFSQQSTFRETQSFPRWLLVLPLAPLLLIWTFTYVDRPSWLGLALTGFISLGVAALLALSRLVTEVRDNGVYVRFAPFQSKFQRIAFTEIVSATAREYSAIGEYGGWGIRYGLGGVGRAYNTSGNQGVQLVFKDGRKLLIGSQRAKELAELIQLNLNSR